MNAVISFLAADVSGSSHVAGWKTGRRLYSAEAP
jgi:hypothetical protein